MLDRSTVADQTLQGEYLRRARHCWACYTIAVGNEGVHRCLTITALASLLLGRVDYRTQVQYRRSEVIAIQYTSTREAIAAVLPECFQTADPPVVTVSFV